MGERYRTVLSWKWDDDTLVIQKREPKGMSVKTKTKKNKQKNKQWN